MDLIHKPQDCKIILGLRAEGEPGLSTSEAAFVNRALADVRGLGANVVRATSLDEVRGPPTAVTAFVAHHDPAGGLQLGHRLVALPAVLATIGTDYVGTIDLAVCNTQRTSAEVELARCCPHARCVLFSPELPIVLRASVLRATIGVLARSNTRYLDALALVLYAMGKEKTWMWSWTTR